MPQIPQISGPLTGGKTLTSGNSGSNTPQGADAFSLNGVNPVQRPTTVGQKGSANVGDNNPDISANAKGSLGVPVAKDPSMAVETLHDVFSGDLLENAKLNGYTELVGEIDDLTKAIYINPDKLMNEILTQEKDNTVFAGNTLFDILRQISAGAGEDTKELVANLLKSLNYAMSRNDIITAIKSNIRFLADYFGQNTTLSKNLNALYEKWNAGDPTENFEALKNETAALMRTISGSLQSDSRTEVLVPLVTHNLSRYNTNEYMMKEAFSQLMSQVPSASVRDALSKSFALYVSDLIKNNAEGYTNAPLTSKDVSAEKAAIIIYLSKLAGNSEERGESHSSAAASFGAGGESTVQSSSDSIPGINQPADSSSEDSAQNIPQIQGQEAASPNGVSQPQEQGQGEGTVSQSGTNQPQVQGENTVSQNGVNQPHSQEEQFLLDQYGLPVLDDDGNPIPLNSEQTTLNPTAGNPPPENGQNTASNSVAQPDSPETAALKSDAGRDIGRERDMQTDEKTSFDSEKYRRTVSISDTRISYTVQNFKSGVIKGKDAIDQLLNLLIPKSSPDVAEVIHTAVNGTDNLSEMVNFLNKVLENVPDIPERQTLCDAFEEILGVMAKNQEMPTQKFSGYESETMKALTAFIDKNVNHPAIRGIDNFNASNLLQSMLNAPGVFTPLAHYIIPLQVEDTRAFGEFWVDNDNSSSSGGGEGEEKHFHLFLTFDVEAVGRFEVDAYSKGNKLNLSVLYPKSYRYRVPSLTDKITKIAAGVGYNIENFKTGILIKPHTLAETFPRIKENRRSFDVKA